MLARELARELADLLGACRRAAAGVAPANGGEAAGPLKAPLKRAPSMRRHKGKGKGKDKAAATAAAVAAHEAVAADEVAAVGGDGSLEGAPEGAGGGRQELLRLTSDPEIQARPSPARAAAAASPRTGSDSFKSGRPSKSACDVLSQARARVPLPLRRRGGTGAAQRDLSPARAGGARGKRGARPRGRAHRRSQLALLRTPLLDIPLLPRTPFTRCHPSR